ncbi:superoxide dismutase [Candidatus Collierbacteria bacterium]|nr:superoxide dismutase [Candidatus Collierbacteria bacterium]
MPFELLKLPYSFDALEPVIDAKTMEIHHDKHHAAYIAKLNDAIAKHPELVNKSVEELLKDINSIPEDVRTAVKNHGGGHANHSLFWEIMTPKSGKPSETFVSEINKVFGSVDKMKDLIVANGMGQFGSGWSWLVVSGGKLKVYATANQDSPLMSGDIPILGIDVWEHAYYLKYQNKRDEYLKNWWSVVNWETVERNWENVQN